MSTHNFTPDYGTEAQKDLIVEQLETIKGLEAKVNEARSMVVDESYTRDCEIDDLKAKLAEGSNSFWGGVAGRAVSKAHKLEAKVADQEYLVAPHLKRIARLETELSEWKEGNRKHAQTNLDLMSQAVDLKQRIVDLMRELKQLKPESEES